MVTAACAAGRRLSSRWQSWIAGAALAVAALLAYANSFDVPLLFDDWLTIRENPKIRQVWPLSEALRPPENTGVGGRPVANLSFVLNYAVSGDSLRGYHAGNLAIHLGAALLLFGVVGRILALEHWPGRFAPHPRTLAAVVAGLWLLHPLQTQSVTYLSQRTESLMGLFYWATLYCFLRGVQPRALAWRVLAVMGCVCGMATKEGMVTAPVACLAIDALLVAGSWRAALRTRAVTHASLAATWLVLAALMRGLHGRGVGFGHGTSWFSHALLECEAVARYLWLAVWPARLVFDYGSDMLPGGVVTGVSVAIVFALIAAAIAGLARRTVWGLCAAWFLLTLAPTSSVVPIPLQPISENRAYLPLAGVCALAVLALHACRPRLVLPAGMFAAVACAMLTFARNVDYGSQVSLWADTAAKRPGSSRALNNYGQALQQAGQHDAARRQFESALRLKPDYAAARANLASALGALGQHERASAEARAALRLDPQNAEASYNLGIALLNQGRPDEATAALSAAAGKRSNFAEAHAWLGRALLQLNRPADAAGHLEQALALKPNVPETHLDLGVARAQVGDSAAAATAFARAVQLAPDHVEARYDLGTAILQRGQPAAAVPHFEHALRLQPRHVGALNNLGLALWQLGQLAAAAARFETALQLDPNIASVRDNLARLRAGQPAPP